jgi:trehalose 6-phosphate synthase
VPHAELMGILRAAHVGLVTPLRDGMNLVAKEFVAAQDPDDPGMLVLSVHAGAACQLEAALQVDPYDTGAVAKALKQALGAARAERRERHQAMLQAIARQGLADWSTSFLDRLGRCRPGPHPDRRVGH